MFKKNFEQLCTNRNIAPTKVCQDIGLSNAAYSCWKENSIPRTTTLNKIANYFGVTVNDLLGITEQKEKPTGKGELSKHEVAVLNAYRNHPEMQPAVDKLLGINNEDYVQLYTAASSKDNRPDEFINMPREKWEKIKNTPDTDDSLM